MTDSERRKADQTILTLVKRAKENQKKKKLQKPVPVTARKSSNVSTFE
jgi:hypothetical protein